MFHTRELNRHTLTHDIDSERFVHEILIHSKMAFDALEATYRNAVIICFDD